MNSNTSGRPEESDCGRSRYALHEWTLTWPINQLIKWLLMYLHYNYIAISPCQSAFHSKLEMAVLFREESMFHFLRKFWNGRFHMIITCTTTGTMTTKYLLTIFKISKQSLCFMLPSLFILIYNTIISRGGGSLWSIIYSLAHLPNLWIFL